MSEAIVTIKYPLANVLYCAFCHKQATALSSTKRQYGIFKAPSRKANYIRHLNKFHDIPADRIKIQCSVCDLMSKKPSRIAWRDIQSHHQREHTAINVITQSKLPQQHGIHSKVIVKKLLPETSYATSTPQESIDRNESIVADDDDRITSLNSVPNNSVKVKQEGCKIISAMGQLFDVVVDSQALVHSTPKPEPQRAYKKPTSSLLPAELSYMSKIVPKARPPIKKSEKRRSSKPCTTVPEKKFRTSSSEL